MDDAQRRLFWHGMLLVLIGLLTGAFLSSYTTPRLGLSAHVGAIMNGTLIVAIGALWKHLVLSPRAATALVWSTVVSGYANWAGLFFAAVFGTSRSTPMLGAGHVGTPLQEGFVEVLLVAGAIGVVAACVLVLVGLGKGRRT